MVKSSVSQSVRELVLPIVENANIELVDIEYKKEGKDWFLRVFLDKQNGITVEDCKKISRQIEDIIEVEDLIPNRYYLEVSSPGLDRPLKKESDFLRYLGKSIQVSLFSPIQEKRKFTGVIQDFKESALFLDVGEETISIPIDNIASAKLEIKIN